MPCALILASCTGAGGPQLVAVTPEAAPRGARVMVEGANLCGEPASCETAGGEFQIGLVLPAAIATVIEYAETRAVIEIPAQAEVGSSEIVLTVNDHASNALAFEVLAP